ncbi:hypothetical protein X743_28435 [Mesorhizobium sp. LNHC252B00]|nr:hypothetical protein X743_28435 [Mesorhizobium sp. LNHC252B00]
MSAMVFDSDASLDEGRVIIRRYGGDVEMAELPWGLQPSKIGGRPFTVMRARAGRFAVTVTSFRHRSRGKAYSFSLADGDWSFSRNLAPGDT